MSEKSEDSPPTKQKKDFEAKRARAISAPLNMTSPNLRSSFSVSSTQSGSLASGKMDYQNMINGSDGPEGEGRDRKSSTRTIGRKRSRIKMGLMFWKTKEEKERSREGSGEGAADDGDSVTRGGAVKGCDV